MGGGWERDGDGDGGVLGILHTGAIAMDCTLEPQPVVIPSFSA